MTQLLANIKCMQRRQLQRAHKKNRRAEQIFYRVQWILSRWFPIFAATEILAINMEQEQEQQSRGSTVAPLAAPLIALTGRAGTERKKCLLNRLKLLVKTKTRIAIIT